MTGRRHRKSPQAHNLNLAKLRDIPQSPPSGSKTIFWDLRVTGLGAYRTSKDQISFVVQYRGPVDGLTRRRSIGRLGQLTLDQARAMAADYAHDVRRGVDPIIESRRRAEEERRSNELVLSVYIEGYLERRAFQGKPHSEREVGIIRNDIVRLLGDKRLDHLTVGDVEKFSKTLADRAPSAMRMGIVHLKTILNEARRRNVIVQSPADAIATPKSGQRARRFDDWEIQRYLEASNDLGGARGDIYEVLMRMLKRKEEISRMTWDELDLAKSRWLLPAARAKDRKDHLVPLPRQVVSIIQAQQPDPTKRQGYVFTLDERTAPEMGSQVKDILDANMHRRVQLANERDRTARTIAHFTIHDGRTSAASRCQEKPLSIPSDIIDLMLLHSVGSMVTRIYQRAQLLEEVGDALQKWNDWLDDLMEQNGAWPGGRNLPALTGRQISDALTLFRKGWPERSDQKRAREKREAENREASSGRGRRNRDRARRTGHQP